MRKLTASILTTLDGVSQDPGGFGEFEYGGWASRYFDEEAAQASLRDLSDYDEFLAGRGTFETLYRAWRDNTGPYPDAIHKIAKRVVTNSLSDPLPWNAKVLRGDPVGSVSALKAESGGNLIMYGAGRLFRTLMINDLIDEYKIAIFPLAVGPGKRLFDFGFSPTAFELADVGRLRSGIVTISYRPSTDGRGR
jgi:dihydrofolate reductase